MFNQKIIYLLFIITFNCFGFEPEISFKFGGGLGFQIDKGTYESHVATNEFPNVLEYEQSNGMILMLNTGIEFTPISFFSVEPEVRLLMKFSGESFELCKTTDLWGIKFSLFDLYAGYYYGETEYNFIIGVLLAKNGTEETTHMFLLGYEWKSVFIEIIYQHGEGVDEVSTGMEFNYGRTNSESFTLMVGYNFSISMN